MRRPSVVAMTVRMTRYGVADRVNRMARMTASMCCEAAGAAANHASGTSSERKIPPTMRVSPSASRIAQEGPEASCSFATCQTIG